MTGRCTAALIASCFVLHAWAAAAYGTAPWWAAWLLELTLAAVAAGLLMLAAAAAPILGRQKGTGA